MKVARDGVLYLMTQTLLIHTTDSMPPIVEMKRVGIFGTETIGLLNKMVKSFNNEVR